MWALVAVPSGAAVHGFTRYSRLIAESGLPIRSSSCLLRLIFGSYGVKAVWVLCLSMGRVRQDLAARSA